MLALTDQTRGTKYKSSAKQKLRKVEFRVVLLARESSHREAARTLQKEAAGNQKVHKEAERRLQGGYMATKSASTSMVDALLVAT